VDPFRPTIFHEEWWLEIATGGKCVFAEVTSNGKVVGRLPYCLEKRQGFTICRMPTLTRFLGPCVEAGEGNVSARFLKRLSITHELISQLPPMSFFKTVCHRGVTESIAFQEEGFRTAVQFTYEIPPQPQEESWKRMRDKTRNCIRRAQEAIKVTDIDDPAHFISFYENIIKAKGVPCEVNLPVALKLIRECLLRKRGRILGATDKSGHLTAAIFCAWDHSSYFYNMTSREESSDKGAISLLVWEAIQDASRRDLIFDFEGALGKGSSRFYASFGGTTSPRFIVSRATPVFRFLSECRALFNKENTFL
jgi:hypothetical protein